MGQKVNPKSLRLKINRSWDSLWYYAKKQFAPNIILDIRLRRELLKKFADCGVSRIEIERSSGKIVVNIFTAKPGLVIGRNGTQIDELRVALAKKYGDIEINVREIKNPELDATIVGEDIAKQLERRIAYRRAAKQAISKAIQAGAKGIKIRFGGRLNGVEIARTETFKEGNIPLHTLRSLIDYSEVRANTMYGVIGIKVWIYKGESFKNQKKSEGVLEKTV
jgi:small subunit ribosomal protein S3